MVKIEDDGLWYDVRRAMFPSSGPALFIDRDGTLIELVDYLADPDGVQLIDAAVDAVRAANKAGVAVVVVTNQSGIGRGYYDWEAYASVQKRIDTLLETCDATIDAVYACPHPPPDAGGPAQSAYRKPAPGMLLRARDDLSLDLKKSWIVGDAVTDLSAGKAAGICGGVLVETGYGTRDRAPADELASVEFSVLHGWQALPELR